MVVGCSIGSYNKMSGTLTILAMEDETKYNVAGLNDFRERHPDLNIKFVDARQSTGGVLEAYSRFLELFDRVQPDVVIGDSLTFPLLASNDRLSVLDTLAREEKIPLDQMNTGTLRWVRNQSGGRLAGIGSQFNTNVLFYNADLFRAYGVEQPQDRMTWDELFITAKRFPSTNQAGEKQFGFFIGQNNDPLELVEQIGGSYDLHDVDWANFRMTIDSQGWNHVYEAVAEWAITLKGGKGYEDGKEQEDGIAMFKNGQIAMLYGDYDTYKRLASLPSAPTWGIVTQPVNPKSPDEGMLSVYDIYAMNTKAPNPEAAKKLIAFMTGEETLRKRSGKMEYLPVYSGVSANFSNVPTETFYKLDAKDYDIVNFWEVPQETSARMRQMKSEALQAVIDGDLTVEEALQNIQREGQALLDKEKK